MAEPFSTTDIYYVNADCNSYNSNDCFSQTNLDISNCQCKYKENVDKLNQVNSSSGLTKEQYGDLNKEHVLLVFNNVSLGIGIVGMMWMIYSNSV
jgi:hypothetical protein